MRGADAGEEEEIVDEGKSVGTRDEEDGEGWEEYVYESE